MAGQHSLWSGALRLFATVSICIAGQQGVPAHEGAHEHGNSTTAEATPGTASLQLHVSLTKPAEREVAVYFSISNRGRRDVLVADKMTAGLLVVEGRSRSMTPLLVWDGMPAAYHLLHPIAPGVRPSTRSALWRGVEVQPSATHPITGMRKLYEMFPEREKRATIAAYVEGTVLAWDGEEERFLPTPFRIVSEPVPWAAWAHVFAGEKANEASVTDATRGDTTD